MRSGHTRLIAFIGWGLTALLAGCAPVGPDYQPPRPELPAAWSGTGEAGAANAGTNALETWWTLFDDPRLDGLIQRAVAANPDLKIAVARIQQARAQYRIATVALAPAVDVSGTYTGTRISENTGSSSAGTTQELYQAGFDAGWELDIFGGARRSVEAAGARLAATAENRRDVLVSLEAEVARNYLELRGSQQRLKAARKNVGIQERTLHLVRGRQDSGLGNRLEVAQAETQLALTRTQLPPLENSAGASIYSLSLLLGLPPRALEKELARGEPLPARPAWLPETLPSDLLRRRPDIRRAERQLAAATADIGVATAELFPRFSLTGLLGLQSTSLGDLISAGSRYWTVGPTVSWPLFDAGRARANIDLNRSRQEEAQAAYEKTVLAALGEVESALLGLSRETETFRSLADAVHSGQQAVELARGRYHAGISDILSLLQSQTALYLSQDQLIQSEQRLAFYQVALFKALGGGWEIDQDESNISSRPLAKTMADLQPIRMGEVNQ
jgi:NodT family efflux transporter outer membrane factor (OMF) lipoprotein